MAIYWHETQEVVGMKISALRDDQNRHFGLGDSRAEIAISLGDGWEEIWSGPPFWVTKVRDWVVENLVEGVSIDEVVDAILENPDKFHYLGR
jgi:hypothetical protein